MNSDYRNLKTAYLDNTNMQKIKENYVNKFATESMNDGSISSNNVFFEINLEKTNDIDFNQNNKTEYKKGNDKVVYDASFTTATITPDQAKIKGACTEQRIYSLVLGSVSYRSGNGLIITSIFRNPYKSDTAPSPDSGWTSAPSAWVFGNGTTGYNKVVKDGSTRKITYSYDSTIEGNLNTISTANDIRVNNNTGEITLPIKYIKNIPTTTTNPYYLKNFEKRTDSPTLPVYEINLGYVVTGVCSKTTTVPNNNFNVRVKLIGAKFN